MMSLRSAIPSISMAFLCNHLQEGQATFQYERATPPRSEAEVCHIGFTVNRTQ
jgi:hypothetical protein